MVSGDMVGNTNTKQAPGDMKQVQIEIPCPTVGYLRCSSAGRREIGDASRSGAIERDPDKLVYIERMWANESEMAFARHKVGARVDII